jgi:molybdate transport system substrate-binding protein
VTTHGGDSFRRCRCAPAGVGRGSGRRRRRWHRSTAGLGTLIVVALVAGCAGGGPGVDADGGAGEDGGPLVVSAASSLASVFGVIAEEFAADTGVEVTLNLDASSSLASQVLEGAPVDVVALADPASMQRLADADVLSGPPASFATTTLVIVTPPANPAGITSLADLVDVDVVALCALQAPCGRYAEQALDAAGVALGDGRVTRTRNATATLTAVADGDALAGIVYVTDARAAGERVEVVPLPATDVVATYSIATTSRRVAARAFVDWVVGPSGQASLADAGFGPQAEASS